MLVFWGRKISKGIGSAKALRQELTRRSGRRRGQRDADYVGPLLLLLLSRFSHIRLCATPQTAAHQAPPSLGFSRQEHEWVAISFSNAWKWKVKVKSLSRIQLFAAPWTAAHQAPPSMGFSRRRAFRSRYRFWILFWEAWEAIVKALGMKQWN